MLSMECLNGTTGVSVSQIIQALDSNKRCSSKTNGSGAESSVSMHLQVNSLQQQPVEDTHLTAVTDHNAAVLPTFKAGGCAAPHGLNKYSPIQERRHVPPPLSASAQLPRGPQSPLASAQSSQPEVEHRKTLNACSIFTGSGDNHSCIRGRFSQMFLKFISVCSVWILW